MMKLSNLVNRPLGKIGLILTRRINVIPSDRLSKARQNLFQSLDFQVVIDIGANSGQWAAEIIKNGYRGPIISIEPTRNAFSELEKIASSHESWNIVNCAVDTQDGFREIQIASNSGLSSSFFPLMEDHKLADPEVILVDTEVVKTSTLESLIGIYGHETYYIKIDTQGAELLILESLKEISFRKVFAFEIEVSLVGTYETGALVEEIIEFMRMKNFRPYRIENGLARPNFGQQVQVDIIFLRNDLAALVP